MRNYFIPSTEDYPEGTPLGEVRSEVKFLFFENDALFFRQEIKEVLYKSISKGMYFLLRFYQVLT